MLLRWPLRDDRQFDVSGSAALLINEIALEASCCWHSCSIVALCRRQHTPFLQQESLVSLQIGWAHGRSSVGGDPPSGGILHPHEPYVRNPRSSRPRHGLPLASGQNMHSLPWGRAPAQRAENDRTPNA